MPLSYEYECPVHGLVELEHSIREDRRKQRCPVMAGKKYPPGAPFAASVLGRDFPGCMMYAKICGKRLKPLISASAHLSSLNPAIFVGRDWTFKQGASWRDAGTIHYDSRSETYYDHVVAKPEPAAVRGPVPTVMEGEKAMSNRGERWRETLAFLEDASCEQCGCAKYAACYPPCAWDRRFAAKGRAVCTTPACLREARKKRPRDKKRKAAA